jgi:hypothetical protein
MHHPAALDRRRAGGVGIDTKVGGAGQRERLGLADAAGGLAAGGLLI